MSETIPASSSNKIAFTGTNSSGKTTMALEVTARLKAENHYLAEVVSSQDRKVTWKDAHFPIDPRAHYGMISGLIYAEVAAELKGDAKVVITDRSVLDLYAIALTDHPTHPMVLNMRPMVDAWAESYSKIFYLPPLEYQEDGKRPPNEFRMRTHATLLELLGKGQYPNVEMISDRTTVMRKVRDHLNIGSLHPTILGFTEKMNYLAADLQCNLYVKPPKWSTSDIDLWFEPGCPNAPLPSYEDVRSKLAYIFGTPAKFDVMFIPPGCAHVVQAEHPSVIRFACPQ